MSSSGYNDKAKLAAALELARSFKSTKTKAGKGTHISPDLLLDIDLTSL